MRSKTIFVKFVSDVPLINQNSLCDRFLIFLSTERPFKTKSLAENKLSNSPFSYLNLRQQFVAHFCFALCHSHAILF